MTPHRAAVYILSSISQPFSKKNLEAYTVTDIDASKISKSLKEDANNYLYSAAISIADAIHGIHGSYYCWATVKLYYSTFYCLRALLALNDYSIFYIENKPKIIRARGGEKIRNPPAGRRRTTTHGIVINLFNITNEMHYLLSQEIGNENPLDWLEQKRVEMNYQSAKFSDPDVPQHFSILNKRSVR